MLGVIYVARRVLTLSLKLSLFFYFSTIEVLAQPFNKIAEVIVGPTSSSFNFHAQERICQSPAWVLSTALNVSKQNKTDILSQFDPLWQENLLNGKFEELQSIIIPGGIIDIPSNLVYIENSANDIIVLDINTGRVIRHINGVCLPLAMIDNVLYALSRIKSDARSFYNLVAIDNEDKHIDFGKISLPDWLELPTDGDRQKFIFNAHCYNSLLSVAWQASRRQMFPNPLFLIIPAMAQPTAMQGNFTCNVNGQSITSQAIQEGNDDFLGYLTANENLPAQIVLDKDTVAIRKYNYYLFLLLRYFAPEHNVTGAGVVAERELRVKDMRTGKILWSHILPADFMPLAF